MSTSEYLLLIVSIILGLGLADLLISFRKLIHNSERVRWHWLPMFWAGFTLLTVIQNWWGTYDVIRADVWTNYFAFTLLILLYIVLYMICSLAIPDNIPNDEILDLEAFYFAKRQRYWYFGLYIAYILLAKVSLIFRDINPPVMEEIIRGAVIILLISLILVKKKIYHYVVSVGILGLLIFFIIRFTLVL